MNHPFFIFTLGAALPKMFLDYELEDFDHSVKLNYLGQVYVAHVRLNKKKKKEGIEIIIYIDF